MYIRSVKAVKIKLAFRNVHGVTPEVALLDSGATENFLDYNVWKSVKAPSCLKVRLARLVLRQVLIERSLWEIPKTLREEMT